MENMFQICIVYLLLVTCSSAQNVPAFFTFGDSSVDVGNNNYLRTAAKADNIPNGIDFGNPTGRFTNGRTAFDILQQDVGLKNFTPPFLAPTAVGDVLLHGVNYACATCGIFNSTGSQYGETLGISAQVSYHERTVAAIRSRIGVPAAQKLLRKALYAVAIGSNDLLSKDQFIHTQLTLDEYLDFLISILRSQFQVLYNLDARKIIVNNAGLIGCCPFAKDILFVPDGSCADQLNQIAQMYNKRLKGLVLELNKDLKAAKFVLANSYRITEDIIKNYASYGFENETSACCSIAGRRGGLSTCLPFSKVCPDRSKYVYWDAFHMTDAANIITARHMMDGGLTYMFPMNIRQLVQS